jgi:hypothetical protein
LNGIETTCVSASRLAAAVKRKKMCFISAPFV